VPCLLVAGCGASCLSSIARPVGGWVRYKLTHEVDDLEEGSGFMHIKFT
jgi:hypothetical protein